MTQALLEPSTEGPVLADVCPSPGDLLAHVRSLRRAADEAERALLLAAVEWAHAHPADAGDDAAWAPWRRWRRHRRPSPEALPGVLAGVDPFCQLDLSVVEGIAAGEDPDEAAGWCGIPAIAWDAPAAFAAANGMSTLAGRNLIRDALVLCHRMPRTWAQVGAGEVVAWRARKVAQAVLGRPDDVVAAVDAEVAPVAGVIGPVQLDRLVEATVLRLHAEELEIVSAEALDAQGVDLDTSSMGHTGVAELRARGEWSALHDFHTTLGALADALGREGGEGEGLPYGTRQVMAMAVLADPERAAALLTGAQVPAGSRSVTTYVHLSEANLLGLDPVARSEDLGPVLDTLVRDWCGRPGVRVVVRPVIDLTRTLGAGHHDCPVPSSEAAACHAADTAGDGRVPAWLAERIGLADPVCTFPWCQRAARRCDVDHSVESDRGGPTCECNLAPACRHHHNLKTHAGWRHHRLRPPPDDATLRDLRLHVWTDPHGHRYLTTSRLGPAGPNHRTLALD